MAEVSRLSAGQGRGAQTWRLQHHALRQPLNALGLFCSALKMQPLTAAQVPLVSGIAEAAVSIERLVDEHFAALQGLSQADTAGPGVREADAPTWPGLQIERPPQEFSSPCGSGAGERRDCHIVIVDDDHAARTGLAMLLEAWGASAEAFAGIDALGRWLQAPPATPPDLMILDYHLPRPGDGLQALSLAHRAWPGQRLRALLITGDDRAAVANALTDGTMKCLLKPVQPAPLLAAVRELVGPQFGM